MHRLTVVKELRMRIRIQVGLMKKTQLETDLAPGPEILKIRVRSYQTL